MKRIIIEVEQDELRLPVRICESYKEMAEATGLTTRQIQSACQNHKSHGMATRFERIIIEED